MIYPKFIKEGSLIGVPAPSNGCYDDTDKARYYNAKSNMEKLGYRIKWSKNIFNSEKCRSAGAKIRAEELNEMFEDNEVEAIWCASGGEFLVEILPYVDFEKIVNNPKWVEGFSDPTGILFPLTTKYDIATIYGNNFKSLGVEDFDRSLWENIQIIKGDIVSQKSYDMYEEERTQKITGLEGYNLTGKVQWESLDDNSVQFKGRMIAGCIDIISEIAGTKYDGTIKFIEKYKNDGIVWGFDNCDLSKEELIRTLWKLNELGYFEYTAGIVFGRCGNDTTYLEYDMENCLKDSVISELDIPIIYDADISHKGPSMTIINGALATVNYKDGKGEISFELV